MAVEDYVFDEYAATSLDPIMNHEMAHSAHYEEQITALERKLALELRDAREKIMRYREKRALVESHIRFARLLNPSVIMRTLDKCLEIIHEVEWKLPGIRSQLLEVRNAYDLGRRRAKTLQSDMEWKAKSDFEQWRSTLLGKSPLSAAHVKREWLKLLWRLVLGMLVLLIFFSFCRVLARWN